MNSEELLVTQILELIQEKNLSVFDARSVLQRSIRALEQASFLKPESIKDLFKANESQAE